MSLKMLFTIAIVVALIVYVSVDYFRSLRQNRKTFARKTWEWIKNIMDILWGI
jgi:bacteriorhodopsin